MTTKEGAARTRLPAARRHPERSPAQSKDLVLQLRIFFTESNRLIFGMIPKTFLKSLAPEGFVPKRDERFG